MEGSDPAGQVAPPARDRPSTTFGWSVVVVLIAAVLVFDLIWKSRKS